MVRSRLRVDEREYGYELRYIVQRGAGGPEEIYVIQLRDRRRTRSTPMPVSWSFVPVDALPSIPELFGRGAKEDRALRDWKIMGNAIAAAFTGKGPFTVPPLPRDFDTILIHAGPGVSIELDDRILRTLPGGAQAVDFANRRLPGYRPFVQVYRHQSESTVPEVGESTGLFLANAAYVTHALPETEFTATDAASFFEYLVDFPSTTENMSVDDLVRSVGGELSPIVEFIDTRRPVESFRTEEPANYGQLYVGAVMQMTNKVFAGDEVKVTPMPWGTRLSHFTSMINIDIRVPTVAADPMFSVELREATLGHQVTNRGDEINHRARYAFRIDEHALLERIYEWVPTFMMEGGGELTEEELAEIEETQQAPLRFQALVWRLRHAGRAEDVPPITIVKTPGVRVSVSAPMLAEIVGRQAELTGTGEVAQSNELRHVTEIPLVECWQVDRIEQVPEQGDDFEIPGGARPLSLVGQRDGTQRLTDEMTADLIDAGLRLAAGPAGDILDIAELSYGLYSGRDFYGRKVTSEHLFLMGLSVLPIVNGAMLRAGIKLPPVLARALRLSAGGAAVAATGLLAREVYQYWDMVDSASPDTTAEFF